MLELAGPGGFRERDGDAGPDEGHVVLIHGLGGIGKTTLVRQLREVAMAGGGRRLVAAQVLDFEGERERYPGDYAGAEGPPIWRVLEGLYGGIRGALADRKRLAARTHSAFADFRRAMAAQPELTQRAAGLGIGAVFGRRQMEAQEAAALAALAGQAGRAAGLAMPGAGAVAGPAAAQAARAVLGAAARRGQDQVSVEAYEALAGDLASLVAAFARGLREFSRRATPVVLFIDTGELLGGAMAWLRDAMKASGRHVIWVTGLRLEAESDGGPGSTIARFRREIHDTRLRLMPLTSFDDRTAWACLAAALDPGLLERLDMDAVMRLTRGIPLALDLAGCWPAGRTRPMPWPRFATARYPRSSGTWQAATWCTLRPFPGSPRTCQCCTGWRWCPAPDGKTPAIPGTSPSI